LISRRSFIAGAGAAAAVAAGAGRPARADREDCWHMTPSGPQTFTALAKSLDEPI
jgi:hypothetical protein